MNSERVNISRPGADASGAIGISNLRTSQTSLAGTSARITVNSTSIDALMVYTSSGQLAAILPSRTPTGDGALTVTYNGTESQTSPIKVVPSALGVYTVTSNGLGPGIITGADYAIKSLRSPARPGEIAVLWGTGLGAAEGDESVPPTPVNQFSPEVFIGGRQAKVMYAGRAGCCSGLDQINFVVPDGVSGCFVPVAVRNAGVTSNFTTLPVSSAGPCSDASGFSTELLTRAADGGSIRTAFAAVGPLTILHEFGFLLSESVAARLSLVLGKRVDPRDVAKLMTAQSSERMRLASQMRKKYGVRSASQTRRLLRELRALVSDNSEALSRYSRGSRIWPPRRRNTQRCFRHRGPAPCFRTCRARPGAPKGSYIRWTAASR